MLLTFAADVPHPAADRIRAFVAQKNVAGTAQIIRPLARGGVVQADDKVARGSARKPPLNLLPWREKIRQRNHTEIVHQRRAEHRRSAERRRHARDDFDVHILIVFRKLQERPGHAVHTGVAAAHERHRAAAARCFQRPPAPLDLARHRCCKALLSRKKRLHEINVYGVAAQHVRALHCSDRLSRHVFFSARADAHHVDLIHHTTANPG